MKLFENLKSALGEEAVEELQQKFHEAVEDGVKIKLGERVKQLEEKSEEFIEKKVASLVESKEKYILFRRILCYSLRTLNCGRRLSRTGNSSYDERSVRIIRRIFKYIILIFRPSNHY